MNEALAELAVEASAGLPQPWARGVREWTERGGRELVRELRRAVPTGQETVAPPWWAVAARAAQWALLAMALAGAAGLLGRVAWAWAWPWEVSVLLLVAGVLAGPALAVACREAARVPARRHGKEAERRLRASVEERGTARVLVPVEAELRRYRAVRQRYGAATGN